MSQPQDSGNWPDQSWPTAQPQQPGYPDVSAQPASGYPAAYQQPGYAYPVVVSGPPTNGLSIAAMVVSIIGALGLCFYGLGGFLGAVGAILGHVSRRQIRERGEGGDGMALAGIIVGWIATGIAVLATIAIIVLVVFAVNAESSGSSSSFD